MRKIGVYFTVFSRFSANFAKFGQFYSNFRVKKQTLGQQVTEFSMGARSMGDNFKNRGSLGDKFLKRGALGVDAALTKGVY